MADYEKVKSAITEQVDYEEFRELLRGTTAKNLIGADDRGMDLIHHAILVNNPDCVRLLLAKGVVQKHENSTSCTYLHLAAVVQSATIVNIMLQDRPSDLYVTCQSDELFSVVSFFPKWSNINSLFGCKNNNYNVLVGSGNTNEEVGNDDNITVIRETISAIDVAAILKNMKCLEVMLNSKALGSSLKLSILERAIEMKSLHALRFLLDCDISISVSDIAKAFKKALMQKLPTFVDVLLEHCDKQRIYQLEQVLNGMNPYHVMFMYSSAFQVHGSKKRYLGLKETTKVLIKHGFSLNTSSPVGSYPLYSLICSLIIESVQFPVAAPVHHLETLHTLLNNGIDCNYTENQDDTYSGDILTDIKRSIACGRDLYRSAFHAFIHEMSINQIVSTQLEFIEESLEHLCRCGAKVDDRLLGEMMQVLNFQHSQGNAIDGIRIIGILLKAGADPNVSFPCPALSVEDSSATLYAPALYLAELLAWRHLTEIGLLQVKANKCIRQSLYVLNFMDHVTAVKAILEIENVFKSAILWTNEDLPDHVYVEFQHHVEKELKLYIQPKTLFFLCEKKIWFCLGREENNFYKLGLPKKLANKAIHLFF